MFEVVFEHIGVKLPRHVERSDRAACCRAPDPALAREEISPADDADRVDVAWAVAFSVLQSNDALDEHLERLGGFASQAERFSIATHKVMMSRPVTRQEPG